MPAGAFGAVRPVVAIPPTATAAGPFHEATGGYAAPKAPAGQSCLDGEYFSAQPCQYDIDLNKKMTNDTAANYDVSRQTEPRLQDKSTRNC